LPQNCPPTQARSSNQQLRPAACRPTPRRPWRPTPPPPPGAAGLPPLRVRGSHNHGHPAGSHGLCAAAHTGVPPRRGLQGPLLLPLPLLPAHQRQHHLRPGRLPHLWRQPAAGLNVAVLPALCRRAGLCSHAGRRPRRRAGLLGCVAQPCPAFAPPADLLPQA
jgi:hypothetical protein